MWRKTSRQIAAMGLCVSLLSACGAIPADSIGTLDRARDGELVVGVSAHQPWTEVSDSGEYSGSEVDLIEGFAESIGADVQWCAAPESVLAAKIKGDQLDVVIGGLTSTSPWSTHMAFTRPYTKVDGESMVMGTRLGENELLVALERYLAKEFGETS